MSLLTRIKLGLAAIALLIIGGLYSLLNIRTKQRNKAKYEAEKASLETDAAVNAVKTHEKAKQQKDDINEAIQESRDADFDTVVKRMRERARDYHGDSK